MRDDILPLILKQKYRLYEKKMILDFQFNKKKFQNLFQKTNVLKNSCDIHNAGQRQI